MSMPSKPSPSLLLPTGQGEGKQSIIASGKPIREITFAQAINEALAEEMRRDPKVFIIGEDVAEAGTPFKVLSGLVQEFGKERVIDSPISEAGIRVGSAAQPKPARVVQPHSRLEGRAAGHAVRRQGIAQDSDPG